MCRRRDEDAVADLGAKIRVKKGLQADPMHVEDSLEALCIAFEGRPGRGCSTERAKRN